MVSGEPDFNKVFEGMLRRHRNSNSVYTVALTSGQLQKARYVNPKIESELKDFKAEIKQKFETSHMNQTYSFPRPLLGLSADSAEDYSEQKKRQLSQLR